MSPLRLIRAGTAALFLAVVAPTFAAEGDAEWQKVASVMEGLKSPKTKPSSREEAIAMVKSSLSDFDSARAAALKAAPNHPARWEAALFELMIARARDFAGVPAPSGQTATLADIIAAPDAKPEVKSQASLIDIMESAEAAEGPDGDLAAWTARAEKHLKDYPNEPMNRAVQSKLASLKATAELKTKPLELAFTAVDGTAVDVAKLRGKVVLIDFWATWCGPCVAELPNVLKAYNDLHPKGFEIIGISLDQDKAKLEAFVKERGMAWPQYFDGKGWGNDISTRYSINSIPAMWLVNKKGMVVSTNARDGLAEEVAKLLAEPD